MLLLTYRQDALMWKSETVPNISPLIGYPLSQIITQLKNLVRRANMEEWKRMKKLSKESGAATILKVVASSTQMKVIRSNRTSLIWCIRAVANLISKVKINCHNHNEMPLGVASLLIFLTEQVQISEEMMI